MARIGQDTVELASTTGLSLGIAANGIVITLGEWQTTLKDITVGYLPSWIVKWIEKTSMVPCGKMKSSHIKNRNGLY